jgi:colanic acid/amylovoran biosynthesis glycosyltransferase
MNLFLFTNHFPYEATEQFVVNEFKFTKEFFSEVSVLALYGKKIKVDVDSAYVLENSSSKTNLFFKGIFNTAPFHHHLFEFFSKGIFLSPRKSYWFFISLLITRATLSSRPYKNMFDKLKNTSDTTLYFYWGDNLCWIIPYMAHTLRKNNIQVVMRLHANDLYENVKADYAPLRKKIFSLCDKIIPISENGKTYLSARYPESRKKIIASLLGVFDNGVNPGMKGERLIIVSVSNLVSKKRVHLIFETLQQTNAKITWHHFGDGPLGENLKQQIKNRRQGLEIFLHGYTSNDKVMDFYRSVHVDLFLNVSDSEGIPVAIMEALSFGIPVVATNVGGISEIVNEQVGALIEPDFELAALAAIIQKFSIMDDNSIYELRKNARKIYQEKIDATKNYKKFYSMLTAGSTSEH